MMKSTDHAIVGSVVSAIGVAAFGEQLSLRRKALLWVYGVTLSVFIDLDHFVLARRISGNWACLFEALSHPKRVIVSPGWLFEDLDMKLDRLLSHVVIGGVLTLGSLIVAPFLAAFTALIVYTHVLCDLLHDTNRF